MNHKILYETIYNCILSEQNEISSLTSTNHGIFYAPELYIAFLIGKAIKTQEQEIFGTETIWKREIGLKNGGPSDIVFEINERKIVIELKIRDTVISYQSDIEKLSMLPSDHECYFVALIDVFSTQGLADNRIEKLETDNAHLLTKISTFKSFPTNQEKYKSDTNCLLAIWKLENPVISSVPKDT